MHHVEQFIYASSTSEMLLPDSTQAFFYVPLEEADKLITLWSEVHRKIYLFMRDTSLFLCPSVVDPAMKIWHSRPTWQ